MRKFAPIAVSAIALLALAGCSGGGGSASETGGNAGAEKPESSQTVAEACAIAEEKLTAAQEGLNESMTGVTSGDYSGITDVITSFSAGFDEALEEISNPEVEESLSSIAADYKEIGAALEQLSAAGNDPEKIAELTELSDQMTETSTRLQESSTELQELCA
ncbi:MAG: hypothetical protein K0Q58_414 [Microbacterium sp.]|jgi:hypothetical protein|nr:hypothetical protein [Microbacterium sp.]